MGDMRCIERGLVGKPDRKTSLQRQKRIRDDNIDMNIKGMGGKGGCIFF
jgi:hypothetical protein